MINPLLARAKLAMEENREARQQRLALRAKHEIAANELHRNLLESASLRMEIEMLRRARKE
jgi:hypothetical protein